jgi:hypothetical protein
VKKAALTLILLAINFSAFSQEFKKNEVFIELLGNGLLGSINYERQLGEKPGLGIRVGAGLYGTDTHMTIPVGVNYLIRVVKNHSFLDLGFGATYTKSDGFFYAVTKLPAGYVRRKEFIYLIPSAGLRAYTTKNYIWKITATPFITIGGDLLPSFGLGFGRRL